MQLVKPALTLDGARLLTNSRMSTAKTCLKKHYWAYELGLRPAVDAKPLRMGRAGHKAVEYQAKGMASDDAILATLEEYEGAKPDFHDDGEREYDWQIERKTVACLMAGYFWRWGDMPLEHLAVEKTFKVPIINPETGGKSQTFTAAGMIDGIVRLPDGRIAVKELKTCSDDIGDPSSDYWKRLRIDQQISLYFRAAAQMAEAGEIPEAPTTILYDVIRKPSIGPLLIPLLDEEGFKIVLDEKGERVFKKDGTPRESGDKEKGYTLQSRRQTPEEFGERLTADIGERPDWYYQRKEIPRIEADLLEFDFELWGMSRLLADCKRFGRWPRNTGACIGFGKCPYFTLCTEGWKANNGDVPQGYVRVDDVHPELSEGE